MADNSDLTKLAQKLASDGPYKYERTSRRVRARFNGKYAFDTIHAHYVWEHTYYPQFYVPINSITPDANLTKNGSITGTNDTIHFGTLRVGQKATSRVLILTTKHLQDVLRIDFPSMDQWYEEDVPIYVHPKDPYKRIDVLPSSRSVKVALNGVTLAETSSPVLLFETGLRTRFYLPATCVEWEVLRESATVTYCPYKGRAEYFSGMVGGEVVKDLAWCYRYPTGESGGVAGCVCFYDERVEVWVDGVKEEK